MEFSTRLCKPGDEQALSLVGQATILETYAGIGNGDVECWSTAVTASATCARLFFGHHSSMFVPHLRLVISF
jgi:hypothetical protein